MTRLPFQWIDPDPVPEPIQVNLDPYSHPFRSILYRRGCETAQDAITLLLPKAPEFPRKLELGHIDLAAQLIRSSLKKELKIAVYGDYDTDGITATALLTLALKKVSSDVLPFIPDRLVDGYGLNQSAIDSLHERGVELLITVDNGIRSHAETAYARSLGMTVILTDHHQPPDQLPEADAIINPKLPGDPYPNKNLAGVGVAYKLICALARYFPEISPDEFLDLVALGTVADIVPLLGENRYLVKQGLIHINQHRRQSILSLLGAAGLIDKQVTASDISYQLAPRINSSGRLSDADHLTPLDLLLSSDPAVCGNHAQHLEIHNLRRKRASSNMQERIETRLTSQHPLPPILISLEPDNDLGVAGITAGHLTGKYYLPSIVGAQGPDTTTASCRSIPEFDILSALDRNKELFIQFGGHKLAAGFTLENQNIPLFCQQIMAFAESELTTLDLHPSLEIDAVVTLSDLDQTLHEELKKLEPTGEGNPTPVFAVQNVTAKKVSQVGKGGDHLKFTVSDGTSELPAIAFGLGSLAKSMPKSFHLAFNFSENEFRGRKELQLQVLDLKSV